VAVRAVCAGSFYSDEGQSRVVDLRVGPLLQVLGLGIHINETAATSDGIEQRRLRISPPNRNLMLGKAAVGNDNCIPLT
jgi:hypothetical protein